MVNRVIAIAATLALSGAGVCAAVLGSASAAAGAAAGPAHTSAAVLPPGGPVPAGFRPASVTFVSAQDGWVLGTTRSCAHRPCTSVLRTTNGGRTWAGIPAPKFRLASGGLSTGLQRLRFANRRDGFAFGSQLWVTHNGGSGWHRVRQVPGFISDLETAGGVVYAVTTTGRAERQTVWTSPAGRDAWHRVAGLPVSRGYDGLGEIALHGTAAWIVLGERIFARTAGTTWTRESFRCPAGWGVASIAATSAHRVAVLCAGSPGAGSTLKKLYVSTTGGTHYVLAGRVPRGGDSGILAAPTRSRLFVATASGATWVYASTTGGRTWHTGLRLDDGGLGWSDFGFTTTRQGVAVQGSPAEGSHLWITRNAGRSWQRVSF